MGRSVFLLWIFLGMFGCMAANLPSGRSTSNGDVARIAARSGLPDMTAAAPTAGEADDVVLNRQSDGHFYAEVSINGTPIEMLVDTGATGVALSKDDARRAGVATSIGMDNPIGEGAGGAIYGDVVRLDRVALGGLEASDVTAVVLDGGHMSLLGQDFLRRFDKVEIEGDRMILR